MSKRTFFISAFWDSEAEVFVSESDIVGLHIEAKTIEEFEAVMRDLAVEMIVANHISKSDYRDKSLLDLIPAIVWQRPAPRSVAA